MALRGGGMLWLVLLASSEVAATSSVDQDGVLFMQVEITWQSKAARSASQAAQLPPSSIVPEKIGSEVAVQKESKSIPEGEIDMAEPPDLGDVVAIFDMEGVPIHWHALIWLSVFACLSLLSIVGYCYLGYLPEKGPSQRASSQVQPGVAAEVAAQSIAGYSCLAYFPANEDGPLKSPPSPGGRAESPDGSATSAEAAAPSDDAARLASKNMDDVVDERERKVISRRTNRKSVRRNSWQLSRNWTETWSTEDSHETMGTIAYALNIVADLCPSGFISIAYSMEDIGYIPAFGILVASCCFSCYTMWMVGRTCEITRKSDFASQWAACIGPGGQWVPNVVICIVAVGALLCYACYFGDLLQEVTPAFGFAVPRYACILGASLFPTLPLCYLKNLSALAYSSGFAVIALAYTVVIMTVRAYDGTYGKGGAYWQDLPKGLKPQLPDDSHMWGFGGSALVYINVLAMAFHCHCNACKYYRELHKSTPSSFGRCTLMAMGICAGIYGVTAYMGFKTFGYNAQGTILKNYSINDWPINVAKLGIVCSLIASYGIMFAALRESFFSLLKNVSDQWGNDLIWRQDFLSTLMVAAITVMAIMCKDSGLVDGFVGAFCGNSVIYIIPGLLYAAAISVSFNRTRSNLSSIATSLGLVMFGVVLGIAGLFCLLFYELPRVNTQFQDVAIYSSARMPAPDAFAHIGVPHHQPSRPASGYIMLALVFVPPLSACAAFIVGNRYFS